MQELHLVGFTADLDGLIFSVRQGAKSGSYRVTVDEALIGALAEVRRLADQRRGGQDPSAIADRPSRGRPPREAASGGPARSALSPRQIQDRIRAGWSVEAVADEAGTSDEWVRSFARPVLAELEAVVARARDASVVKGRAGRSALPLAAAVRRNLLDRSVRPAGGVDTGWSAFLLEPGSWVVRFDYEAPNGPQQAEWLYDGASGDLVARDRKAADLGFVAPARPAADDEPASEGDSPALDAAQTVQDDAVAGAAPVIDVPADELPPPKPARAPRKKPAPAGVEPLQLVEPPPPQKRAR